MMRRGTLVACVLIAGAVHAQQQQQQQHQYFRGAATPVSNENAVNTQHVDGVWYGPESVMGPIDMMLLQDKRAAVEYDVEADANAFPGITWPQCQWHVKYAFNYTAQGLIDPNAVYWAQILPGPRMGNAYKIKGRFPPTIYFSWQVYNSLFTGEAAQGTTDYKLKPHWGKNPFVDGSATLDDTGGYELHITPTGEEGYPNELRLPRGMTNTLILRMYKPDPSVSVAIQDIEPPVLYVGRMTGDGKREWRALPRCSEAQKRTFTGLANTFYEINYAQNSGTLGRGIILRDYNCPLNPEKGNVSMVLFEGSWLTPQVQNLVARQSSDSPYLFYCINPNNRWEYFINTMFKLRFKLPKLPTGLYEEVKVADVGNYDVRYMSVSTADGILPQPVVYSVDGQGLKKFYNCTGTWDEWVEIRVAMNEARAKACGFWDDKAVFMPLVSERIHPAKAIILIYRAVLAHGPKTAGAASRACNKGVECGNPAFIRNIMGEYYPELEVYHCEPDGRTWRYNDYWGHH